MPEKKYCCCCIPLKTGCIILGTIYIVIQLSNLISYYQLSSSIVDEENEDDENTQQKKRIQLLIIYSCMGALFRILLGVSMIAAAISEFPFMLRCCAGIIIGIEFFSFIWLLISTPQATNLLWVLSMSFPLIFALYTGFTLWNFADEIDHSQLPVIVYVAPEANGGTLEGNQPQNRWL